MEATNVATTQTKPIEKRFVRPDTIEEMYGTPTATLQAMRSRRIGPAFFKRGRAIYYSIEDYERWLKAGRSEPIGENQAA